ncbi:hypothetical protein BGX34_008159 [Mortierella sp. NVP85]|nr:hypothetical protein BGX34_008159 [Mortierella sp. NVP85]
MSALSNLKREPKASLSFKQIVKIAQATPMESEVEQRLLLPLPSELQKQVRSSTNIRESLIQVINDGQVHRPNEQLVDCLQKLDDKLTENVGLAHRIVDLVSRNNELASENNQVAHENKELLVRVNELQMALNSSQEEMRNLQTQALDRLALIQNNVQALLTQTYELHEYPIPRLFIVLPDNESSWNPLDFLSNKFRIYFLCECGEHTKSINSKIPHHIHLAKHEGYDIARPKEFFQQYGTYVLTILRMLKFCISLAGVAVPAVSLLVRDDVMFKASSSLKMLVGNIQSGMDQVMKYIEKSSDDKDGVIDRSSEQMDANEALEGADLRQLESFLRIKDKNRVLGNLYRIVTGEGHVKWVCIDHYRENYHEKAAEEFCNTVKSLHGEFDENTGRAQVELTSRLQAEQFYLALEKARSIYELKIHLWWETTQSDFKRLRDTVAISNVGVLELDLASYYLKKQDGPTRDILNRNQRYDPILEIMRDRSIQSFTIRGPQNLFKRSSLLSRNGDFPNLRHLGISLFQLREDIPSVRRLIANAPNFSSLAIETGGLGMDNDGALQVYNVIAEHRTYSIDFIHWNLYLPPPPPQESDQTMAAQQYMGHLFKYYCATNSERDIDKDVLRLFWSMVEQCIQPKKRDRPLFNRYMEPSRGPSNGDVGRLKVKLRSSAQAEHFYFALGKATSVHELKVELNWETAQSDLEGLRDTLATTNVGVLKLYLKESVWAAGYDCPLDPILDIMQLPSIQSFTIRGLQNFSKRSNLILRNDDSDLRHLDVSLYEFGDETLVFKRLIASAPNLSSLAINVGALRKGNGHVLQAYNAIAEHRTYSIDFKELDLHLPPPPPKESDQSMAARQCLSHLLEFYCASSSPRDIDRIVPKLFLNKVGSLRESSSEDVGRVALTLESSIQAEHFYFALGKATSVHELKVRLEWEAAQSDFENLRDTLATTNVGVLELYLKKNASAAGYDCPVDPILDIMQLPSIQSFTIRGPQNLFKRSNLLSRNDGFPNLRHLDISFLQLKGDIFGVNCLITKATNLSSLAIRGTEDLVLREDLLDEFILDALAKATNIGPGFRELELKQVDQLGDSFINNISSVVSRSIMYNITIYTRGDEGRLRILRSIQWEHLRVLNLRIKPGTFETNVMQVLVDSLQNTSGKIGLNKFRFQSESDAPLTLPQGNLLQTFMASTSTEWLVLVVDMTLEQVLSLFKSTDFSQLKRLGLWAKKFDSAQVDAILDGLQHTSKLERLSLVGADITDKQRQQMRTKKIYLNPNMLARSYITYIAVAAVALVSMTSAAPAAPAKIPKVSAVAQELPGPDFLSVPKEMFPLCCVHKIAACCYGEQ